MGIQWLNELLGVAMTDEEEITLYLKFPEYLPLIKRKKLGVKEAKILYGLIRTTLGRATISAVRKKHNILFGSRIGTGSGKAILQKAYCLDSGEIYCAKISLKGSSYSAENELHISSTLKSHPNITLIAKSLNFCHEEGSQEPLTALLMPLFHVSLAELLSSSLEPFMTIEMFKSIAFGLLSAAARFQECSLSHCDIKPENIMMDNSVFKPVLIDFGAVVTIGEAVVEYTKFYALDASLQSVTSEFDLFCIVTTLVRCFSSSFEFLERTKEEMIMFINESCKSNSGLNEYGDICLKLLSCRSSMDGLKLLKDPQ